MATKDELKRGEEIVNDVTERITLKSLRVGCDRVNYHILQKLPTNVKDLMKTFDLSKMPMNKRLNELEEIGLLKRDRYTGNIDKTDLTESFINLIEKLKEDIIKELPKLI